MKPKPKPRKQSVKQKVAGQIGGAIGNLGCAQNNIRSVRLRIAFALSNFNLNDLPEEEVKQINRIISEATLRIKDAAAAMQLLRYTVKQIQDLTYSQAKIKGYDYE